MMEPRLSPEPGQPARRELSINGEKLMVRLEPWDIDGELIPPDTTFTHEGIQYLYCGLDESGAEVIVRVDDSPAAPPTPPLPNRSPEVLSLASLPTTTDPTYVATEADFAALEERFRLNGQSLTVLKSTYSEGYVTVCSNDTGEECIYTLSGTPLNDKRYEIASRFQQGRAVVCEQGATKFSVIKRDGSYLTDWWFEWCDPDGFVNGQLKVKNGERSFTIDIDGKKIPPEELITIAPDALEAKKAEIAKTNPSIRKLDGFREGRAVAVLRDGTFNYAMLTGELLTATPYIYTEPFSEGRAVANDEQGYLFLKRNGEELIPGLRFKKAQSFINGKARVQLNGEWFEIDIDGARIIPASEPIRQPEQLARNNDLTICDPRYQATGPDIIELSKKLGPDYTVQGQTYSEGLVTVQRKDGMYTYYQLPSQEQIPSKVLFKAAYKFSQGRAVVRDLGSRSKEYLIKRDGARLTSDSYDWISSSGYTFGKIPVKQDGEEFELDLDGQRIPAYELGQTIGSEEALSNDLRADRRFMTVGEKFCDRTAVQLRNGDWTYAKVDRSLLTEERFAVVFNYVGDRAVAKRRGSSRYVVLKRDGSLLTDTEYESTADQFVNSVLKVMLDGEWFEIDIDGNRIVPRETVNTTEPVKPESASLERSPQLLRALRDYYREQDAYVYVGAFSDGRAVVEKNGKMWHIKEDGTALSTERYDVVGGFNEGRATVIVEGRHWHIQRDGQRLYEESYDLVGNFANGRALVQQDDRTDYVDIDGIKIPFAEKYASLDNLEILIQELKNKYGSDNVTTITDGRAKVRNASGKWQYVDTRGEPINSDQYDEAFPFAQGRALVKVNSTLSGTFYSFIKRDGTPLTTKIYNFADEFVDGTAQVEDAYGEKYRIDIDGNRIEELPLAKEFVAIWKLSQLKLDQSGQESLTPINITTPLRNSFRSSGKLFGSDDLFDQSNQGAGGQS